MPKYKLGSIGTDTQVQCVETDSQVLYAFGRKGSLKRSLIMKCKV